MSQQLESMLAQIKKSLPEKIATVDTSKSAVETGDPKHSSAALRDFLGKHIVALKAHDGEVDDPKVIVERRTLLSAFIGAPLTNNGVAALQGVISKPIEKGAEKSGHHTGTSHADHKAATVQAFAPVQEPVISICPSCVQSAAKSKAGVEEDSKTEVKAETKAVTPSPLPASVQLADPKIAEPEKSQSSFPFSSPGFSMSAPTQATAPAPAAVTKNEPAFKPTIESPQDSNAKPAAKQGFGGFLAAAFKRGKDPNNLQGDSASDAAAITTSSSSASVESQTTQQSAAVVAWFKHIQAVESALRIGDVHFADTFLSLLFETSSSLSAQPNIVARLNSLRARVLLDRKQFAECEQLLKDSIAEIEKTKFAKNVAAAYCWHALAQCYHNQKQSAEAESAHNKAIAISESSLGNNDPESMYFKEALR